MLVNKSAKALLLTVAVCVMILAGAMTCLKQVVDFLNHLRLLGDLNSGMVGSLMKIVGQLLRLSRGSLGA